MFAATANSLRDLPLMRSRHASCTRQMAGNQDLCCSTTTETLRDIQRRSTMKEYLNHLLALRDLCRDYSTSLGPRSSEICDVWAASLFLRSIVALNAVVALVKYGLNDDAAIIIRTMFEIELQLRMIKDHPEFSIQMIQRAEGFRSGRLKAFIRAIVEGRELPEGITKEALEEQRAQIRVFIKQSNVKNDPNFRYEYETIYSLLSDMAHVSPVGLSHYFKQEESRKLRLNSNESLLSAEFLVALASATELKILGLVAIILKTDLPVRASSVQQESSEIICKAKAQSFEHPNLDDVLPEL
jgi:Family of unknown function (DUF5677)